MGLAEILPRIIPLQPPPAGNHRRHQAARANRTSWSPSTARVFASASSKPCARSKIWPEKNPLRGPAGLGLAPGARQKIPWPCGTNCSACSPSSRIFLRKTFGLNAKFCRPPGARIRRRPRQRRSGSSAATYIAPATPRPWSSCSQAHVSPKPRRLLPVFRSRQSRKAAAADMPNLVPIARRRARSSRSAVAAHDRRLAGRKPPIMHPRRRRTLRRIRRRQARR